MGKQKIIMDQYTITYDADDQSYIIVMDDIDQGSHSVIVESVRGGEFSGRGSIIAALVAAETVVAR